MIRQRRRRRWKTCVLNSFGALAALIFTVGFLGCSAHSGGSNAASSGNGGTVGSDSGSTASSGSDGSAGGPSGLRGCGQGTSCTDGNDLAAPAATDGIQIETPDNAIAVQPGQEQFLCFYKTLPNTAAVDIGTMQSWMTPGSSHHFIAYKVGQG